MASGDQTQRPGRTSDEELYRRMRKGDANAFAALYERHEPPLYGYALHMTGSSVIAEEIAHDVFMTLMAPGSGFDERRGTLDVYLFGITRNLVRAARRKGPVEEAVDQAIEYDILGDLINNETMALLRRALKQMPQGYRDAVVLCDLEELPYEEAAKLMGCPVGTVRSRLHRARALLAAKLKSVNKRSEVSAR